MIGTISVKVAAHNPSFPLEPVYVFVNSAQSFRIMNVPKKIGKWDITKVFVNVSYPDNMVVAKECVLNGSVWVGTVSGCATSGTSINGFVVSASGIDEDGNVVSNYVLGAGDLYVQQLDGTIAPETTAAKMYFYQETPTSPKVGDATFVEGNLNIWNGTEWQPVAQSSDPSYIEDADGNKIEADRDFTYIDDLKWQVAIGVYGTYALSPTSTEEWTYAEAEGIEGNKKVVLKWLDYMSGWELKYYQWSEVMSDWNLLASGVTYDSHQATSLEIEITGDLTETAECQKGATTTVKLATEAYVDGIVGNINTILDIINGEVI